MNTPILLSIVKAEQVGKYLLLLHFNNGEQRIFDFATVYDRNEHTAKLKDPEYFKNFTLDSFTVDWNNEIGFAPEFLYERGRAV